MEAQVVIVKKKPPNDDVGEVKCTYCRTMQPVRRNIKGKYYINCTNDGVIQPALPHFQEWILENATIYGAEKPERTAPRPVPVKSPEPDTSDAPAPAPAVDPPSPNVTVLETKPEPAPVKKSRGFRILKG